MFFILVLGSALATEMTGAYRFEIATSLIVAPYKVNSLGEDALYANDLVLTVADGVGSWSDIGVDAGLYSRKLMFFTDKFFHENKAAYTKDPKSLVIRCAQENKEIGTSTIVVTILDSHTAKLNTANIGDSCYIILRSNADNSAFDIVHKSPDQQHGFNYPFQIGTKGDSPTTAVVNSHQLKIGDLVIVGSDGLFDNVYDETVAQVAHYFREKSLKELADALSRIAFKLSLDRAYKSPFSMAALKVGKKMIGGKTDDIAVVVGKVAKVDATTRASE